MRRKFIYIFLSLILFLTSLNFSEANSNSEKIIVIVQLKSPSYSEFISEKGYYPMTNFSKSAYLSILENEHKNFLYSISSNRVYFKERWHYYLSYNGVSGEIYRDDLEKIKKMQNVKEVYISKKYELRTDIFVPLIKATEVWKIIDKNNFPVTGKGMLIGIIDTGIDYKHPDLGGGIGKNFKVRGGYDFADRDPDPIDPPFQGHGTAVAGIAAANGKVKGVAPDANLMAYKIFSDFGGSALEADIIAAIDRALKDGCNAVNLSLGSSGGKSRGDPETDAVNNAVNLGLIVVAAAGNDGLRSREISWPISAPSSAMNAISVAASDEGGGSVNIVFPKGYETRYIPFVYGDGVPEFPEDKEYELVYCGFGRLKDFEGKDLRGKLALIQRGPLAPETPLLFETKYFNALSFGAEGVIMFNVAPGPNVTMALNVQNYPNVKLKPAVFIMEEDGYLLKSLIQMGVRVTFKRKLRYEGYIADFSSQGPTPDDAFKPDISAPGTNTFTTAPLNQYTYGFSGTSASSPFVCGATVLIKQLNPSWTPIDIKASLMNNAYILINPNNNLPFPWIDQGSGRIDVLASATSPAIINPYSIFIKDSEGEINLTVKNVSDRDLSFKVKSNLISNVTGINLEFMEKEEEFMVKLSDEVKIKFKYKIEDKLTEGYYDAIINFIFEDRDLHVPIIIKKGAPKVPTKALEVISVEPNVISPDQDGINDFIKFKFKLNYGERGLRNQKSYRSRIGGVIIDVLDDTEMQRLGTIYRKVLLNGVYEFIWDGKDFEGKAFLDSGNYKYKLYTVTIEAGNTLRLIEEIAIIGNFRVENVEKPISKILSKDIYYKNTSFFIELYVEKIKNIRELRYHIDYDPQYLAFIGVELGDFIAKYDNKAKLDSLIDETKGTMTINIYTTLKDGLSGEGSILKIKFKTLNDGTVKLSHSATGIDVNNLQVNFIKLDKFIKIEPLLGDINGDGKVDSEDLIIFALAFGSKLGESNYNDKCDFNDDGKIDLDDLFLLAQNFGTKIP